jgi:hypothetical protein
LRISPAAYFKKFFASCFQLAFTLAWRCFSAIGTWLCKPVPNGSQ